MAQLWRLTDDEITGAAGARFGGAAALGDGKGLDVREHERIVRVAERLDVLRARHIGVVTMSAMTRVATGGRTGDSSGRA